MRQLPPKPTLYPYTTLFRSTRDAVVAQLRRGGSQERRGRERGGRHAQVPGSGFPDIVSHPFLLGVRGPDARSEEHTSELQSHVNLVCRLLLEKKKLHVFHLV